MTRPDLDQRQTRTLEIRSVDNEKREISGIGVPWDTEITLWGDWHEKFARGSVDADGAILRYAHREPIGRITHTQDTDEGYEITAVISATARGDEVWQLVKDGVLTRMSIGFDPIEKLVEELEDGGELITWQKVRAREFSVVEFPAYEDARITTHRQQPTTTIDTRDRGEDTMTTPTTDTAAEIRGMSERLEDLERSISTLHHDPEPAAPQFRSFGDYVLAYREGDQQALQYRELVTTSDYADINRPRWLGDITKRMQAKQPITNLFTRLSLPKVGMHTEYAKENADSTIKVAKQTSEGADLVEGKPGTWSVESATVNTYGGVVPDVTRQVIERTTNPNILDTIFRDLAMKYALAIELDVRDFFKGLVTTAEESPEVAMEGGLAGLSVDTLADTLLALGDLYETSTYLMDGILVSPSVFKKLLRLEYSPRALQLVGAPDKQQGRISLSAPGNADLGVFTVQRLPGWDGDHMVSFSREAVTTEEDPGAPLRLEQDNIRNLTRDFAVYGYASIYSSFPDMVKAVKLDAGP